MERLFSEIYNRYFQIVNRLLLKRGTISPKMLKSTVQKYGFGESMLFLLPGLSENRWELFEETEGGFCSKLPGGVTVPLSRLQKRWLKAVLCDPRAALCLDEEQKEKITEVFRDVTPLFHYEDFRYFDRFSDGDDYAEENYRKQFRIIRDAIRNEQILRICYEARTGRVTKLTIRPQYLEYSVKNNCFRLLCEVVGKNRTQKHILRISRMREAEVSDEDPNEELLAYEEKEPEKITLLIRDQRNAVERIMLQFADYRKNTVHLEDNTYRCEIFYDKDDETELLIEILSFGPMIEVVNVPENKRFLGLMRERLQKQKALELI